jgi:hypothetical protein
MSSTRPCLAVLSLALALPALGAARSSEVAPRSIPLAADGTLSIDTYKGTVKVTTWEKAEVLVKARIEADDSCRDTRHDGEDVERTRVNIEGSGSRVSVESDYSHLREHWFSFFPFGGCNARPFVHYEISMPRMASLRLKDYKSDSRLGDLAGDVAIETYKGTVLVDRLDGGLRAETYKGKVEIVAPRAAAFTLDAEADRGDVDTRDFAVTSASRGRRHRSESARGDVNGGGPRVHLATNKGTVRLSAR